MACRPGWSLILAFALTVPAHAAAPTDLVGEPAALLAWPEAIMLAGPRASQQVIVTGRYADGSLRDLTTVCTWRPALPDLVAIRENGYLVPLHDGTTTLTIEAGGKSVEVPVTVKNAARAEPISFRREIIGVLSVAGCNDIRCHGAPSGKAGFRLSLWASDPAADHLQLTRDVLGRRADPLHPDASLLLQKPLGLVNHEGGQRFQTSSREARLLRDWLSEGAGDDRASAVKHIEVTPAARLLGAVAPRQQLAVRATFADGTARDVTRLTVFRSSDDSIATVQPTGLVEFWQSGEVAILCRYLNQLVTVRLTHARPAAGFTWPNPPEHNYVDKHVFAKLKMLGFAPSELCTDQEFVRRVFLDVCGILPTVDEVKAFIGDAKPDKRARLIDTLLERPEYADYWTQKWIDVLRVSKRSIQLEGAKAYHGWLRDQVHKDVGFDQVVRALVTAQGHSYQQPAANYYAVVPQGPDDTSRLANDMVETTAQLFLGVRMQCAKCHNHPYERWSQDDYAGLAAFFNQVKQTRIGPAPNKNDAKLDNRPYQIAVDLKVADLVLRDGRVLPPRFLGGPVATLATDQDRREVLAAWLTRGNNPFFAKALVNRIWFHLHGRGIVEPVDDFRESNPSVNDELLDVLARDFASHGFQAKHVIRVIVNSRTYQLSSRTQPFNDSDHKYFSHVMPRPLPAEVLLDALATVSGVPEKYTDFPAGTRAVQLPVTDIITLPGPYNEYEQHPFMRVFGQPTRDLVCACARERDFNQAQALEMMIGPTVAAKLRDPNNRLAQLLGRKLPDADILNELYLVALSRPPSESAAKAFLAHVAKAEDKRKAWEDVLWTILRSQEFIYRH
jgi:hypothetical protein